MPLKLSRTRVWRTYHGGKLLDQFQGAEDPQDSSFPEEWIASVTQARNTGREHVAHEGLSRVLKADGSHGSLLRDVVAAQPRAALGSAHVDHFGESTGLLVKLLDSSERLTIQVHPDRTAAREVFGSRFGKTEAWYILGGRAIDGEEPYVLFGFKPGVTRAAWRRLFENQDIEGMIGNLHRFPARPGQVFLITGGVPHAIGPGCFLVEVQEPTDYSIRPERTTPAGREIPDEMCHQGAGFDRMFDIFHYDGAEQDEIAGRYCPPERTVRGGTDSVDRQLVGYDHGAPFAMHLVSVSTEYRFAGRGQFATAVVLEGVGDLPEYGLSLRAADELFFPAAAGDFTIRSTGADPLRLAICYPPEVPAG
jgi:mannose-6-phosphate isomerase